MTAPEFDRIQMGASITEVIDEAGEPYAITTSQNGVQQYTYIERIDTGPGVVSQNTYVLTVVKGQIIDKRSSSDSQAFNVQYR